MPKTSQLDVIMQQIDALSIEELLAVRAKIDALIYGKSSPSFAQLAEISHQVNMIYGKSSQSLAQLAEISHQVNMIVGAGYNMMPSGHGTKAEDDSLEQVIQLVDEWMADESGYDEETYPQIEAALTQNRLSI
ncbi:hypothetical protein Cylst_5135 [Cylindrospermum stagnale PCC 7417]|uniref:Uncharacterized protein n=1 Tax=Cylindrospermum stagnale PCC 7417 TaxID=56107 RepID=K9X500_9NOST|nr:hypothetical protein [Cylindrospermum stagnale]AFZ27179.1 hypothetical protein Cylst_5135 [Cylindrospermum stagnale PCC 7417]